MIATLAARHEALAAAGGGGHRMTVVFDAGQNTEDNFAHLAESGMPSSGRSRRDYPTCSRCPPPPASSSMMTASPG